MWFEVHRGHHHYSANGRAHDRRRAVWSAIWLHGSEEDLLHGVLLHAGVRLRVLVCCELADVHGLPLPHGHRVWWADGGGQRVPHGVRGENMAGLLWDHRVLGDRRYADGTFGRCWHWTILFLSAAFFCNKRWQRFSTPVLPALSHPDFCKCPGAK